MTYGWSTTKTAAGYKWTVYSFEYGAGQTLLHSGVCATREQAARKAKKAALYYRRNAA